MGSNPFPRGKGNRIISCPFSNGKGNRKKGEMGAAPYSPVQLGFRFCENASGPSTASFDLNSFDCKS